MGDHPGAASGMEGLVIGEGVKMVVDVVLDDFSDIDVFLMCRHGSSPSCNSAKCSLERELGLKTNAGAIDHNFIVPVTRPNGQDFTGQCHMAAHG
jgi:hypothetical protein